MIEFGIFLDEHFLEGYCCSWSYDFRCSYGGCGAYGLAIKEKGGYFAKIFEIELDFFANYLFFARFIYHE